MKNLQHSLNTTNIILVLKTRKLATHSHTLNSQLVLSNSSLKSMGNVLSGLVTATYEAVFTRCLDSTMRKAAYISNLEDNVNGLGNELQSLIALRDDVMTKVVLAEQQQMQRLNQVQVWLSRVETEETEVGDLVKHGREEIEKLCLGGYCSRNCRSSYKLGKKAAKKGQILADLKSEGAFEVVAERAPEVAVDERPIDQPTITGQRLIFYRVWRCLVEEPVGIIGLYGMGGVGKTTLLMQINNKLCRNTNLFDFVIWVVVSKDLQLEKIQDTIGKKLFCEAWKQVSSDEKALQIFKVLSKKKFVLLLDDVWERVDLTKVGVPIPNPLVASKIVFTTRSLDVCGLMEAKRKFEVQCLKENEAWELFQEKVSKETLDIDPKIPQLAQLVAKECGGLPLALITIGRAMASKKNPEEWSHAIQLLRKSKLVSQIPGMGKDVYAVLKFSYDSLPNDKVRSCLLYCSLYPEDHKIFKNELIDLWNSEGFLEEDDITKVQNEGYSIIGVLNRACLLEEVQFKLLDEDCVKLHDVIRDMIIWIACEVEKEKEHLSIHAGVGLIEAPKVENWEGVRRMSLMHNKIEHLSGVPTAPNLQTLFLNDNELVEITSSFFQFMSSLQVLDLSRNRHLIELPFGISKLVSLQHLLLAGTGIDKLPIELKALVNLKYLDLDNTSELRTIPCGLLSNLSKLIKLQMFSCGYNVIPEEVEGNVLFGDGQLFVKELLGLTSLNELHISLKSLVALQGLLRSHKLRSCTKFLCLSCFEYVKAFNVLSLADLKHLRYLQFEDFNDLEELKIENVENIEKTRQSYGFHFQLSLVAIDGCSKLRDLTFLIFCPNLQNLFVSNCDEIEEMISVGRLSEVHAEMKGDLNPFGKLQTLILQNLQNLKSIYWEALSFPHLESISVENCPKLKKLPLNSNSAKECKVVITSEEHWWKELQWEDEATRNAFLPHFNSVSIKDIIRNTFGMDLNLD